MVLMICATAQVNGNTELARELYTKARNYSAKRDYPNAILVYNQLVQLEPRNLIYRRELAYGYYSAGDLSRATQIITPLLSANEADEETFLSASQIFTARGIKKQAIDAVERGLKKYPNSGLLYANLGTLHAQQKKYDKAEMMWEKGVEQDPNYHMNYYNLAKNYFVSKRPLWAIIYGETFINMERYSQRTEEIKKLVFDSYKQLIANNQLAQFASPNEQKKIERSRSSFGRKVNNIYKELSGVVLGGIDIDNVVMLRSRFLLEWMQMQNDQLPFYLFEYMDDIQAKGYFEAYNQWLFGKAANEKQFISWVKSNAASYHNFETYFNVLPFKNKPDQYYK